MEDHDRADPVTRPRRSLRPAAGPRRARRRPVVDFKTPTEIKCVRHAAGAN